MDEKQIYNLLLDFQKIPRKKRHRTFLEISGYPHYENVCSNILQFYFDTSNEHNLTDLFVKSILQALNENFPNEDTMDTISVEREVFTEKGNRIDLVIETHCCIIGIENKFFHSLNNDLQDYYNTLDSKSHNKVVIGVVLSLNEVEKTNSGFKNITYDGFFKSIQNNLGNYIINGNNEYVIFLKQFIESINNLKGIGMKNEEMNIFFMNNINVIKELTTEFTKFENEIFSKVYQLNQMIDEEKTANSYNEQWIHEKRCLVHDYDIEGHSIAVDASVSPTGWKIELFGRNEKSKNYINTKKFKSKISETFDDYSGDKKVFEEFELDKIEVVKKSLIRLLGLIEDYKRES